jgi:membrane-associated protease RseP (regulator of RpoE activity)
VPIYVLGLKLSTVVRIPQGPAEGAYVQFGDAVLPKLIERLTLGPLPSDFDILLHPVGVAAWFGFFVTALNLIPAGQLDGGHIVYALFGSRHALISKLAVGGLVLIGLAFGSINWLVWAALIVGIMGFRHGPTMDDVTPLDGRRRALGLFALVLLFLLLPPVPLSVR